MIVHDFALLVKQVRMDMYHFRLKLVLSSEEKFSGGFIFASHFFNISRGFNFANWLPVDFSRGFIFANLSFINVS